MPIQSGNDLFSPSPKVQMAVYLGNGSLGQRECADSSRTIGHRIYVDSQETEASVWSLWLSLAHSGSSDPPGSHFPGPYMYNWPHVLSLTFWLNSHLESGGSSSLLIMPGFLRSDQGGLSVSSPSGELEDACGLHR